MTVQLTIKNYRCFVSPVSIQVGKGFTAFVGVNNAGKSTIMRFLLEIRPLLKMIGSDSTNFTAAMIHPAGVGGLILQHVIDQDEVFSNLNKHGLEFWFEFSGTDVPLDHAVTKATFRVERDLRWKCELEVGGRPLNVRGRGAVAYAASQLFHESRLVANLSRVVYIAETLSSTLYVGPFRNTINVGTKADYLDIQIGEAFIKQFRILKTGSSKQASTEIQTLTEKIQKIFEFTNLDIIPSADDTSLHITVNGKPYKQHELGSGLSQFIVVLANASIKRPKIVLIDEPELNLHPRLQLDFLTTLASYAEEGVWFSTHSIGLARASAERVYSVIRRGEGDSVVRLLAATPRLAEFLGEMSFSTHKELGFEKILLVEGPTELKAIQQFLSKMRKDHKVVLLPLHGHMPYAEEFDELLRISQDVEVLIDSERSNANDALSPDRAAFIDLCNKRQIRAHALERRAMENYFDDATIKNVFGDAYRALGPYEKFDDVQPHWSKSLNWKLASAMSLDDMLKTDLGQFLRQL
jgi:ABC-type branched-subunit amino acid transport system ATPase component